jgi:phage tail-like protein
VAAGTLGACPHGKEATVPQEEPSTVSHFELQLGGREAVGGFCECSGMDSETEVIEEKATDARGHPYVRKVAGATKWSNITLRRGVDTNWMLWEWREQVINDGSDKARVDGTISLIDYDGKPILTYEFVRGFPVKYGAVTLNASSNDVALEEVVIVHEGLTRVA